MARTEICEDSSVEAELVAHALDLLPAGAEYPASIFTLIVEVLPPGKPQEFRRAWRVCDRK